MYYTCQHIDIAFLCCFFVASLMPIGWGIPTQIIVKLVVSINILVDNKLEIIVSIKLEQILFNTSFFEFGVDLC